MRIATWNLERPKLGGLRKNQAIFDRMVEVDADLWILTETSSAIALPGYAAVASPPDSAYHAAGENYTTVLSRWPIRQCLPTWNATLSVCAEVLCPNGACLVYGTIIAYANYKGSDGNSKRWAEHRKSIAAQGHDWLRLRTEYPEHGLIIAGDFNQSRDGSGWYEDAVSVAALTAALDACDVACVTQQNFRETYGLDRSTIDHICLGGPLQSRPVQVSAWPGATGTGLRVSDHNGVAVRVDA
jgi:hypothetical protein